MSSQCHKVLFALVYNIFVIYLNKKQERELSLLLKPQQLTNNNN